MPSHANSLIRSARFDRKTKISPPYGSAPSVCATRAARPLTPRRKSTGWRCHPHSQPRPRCDQRPPRRTAAKTRESVAVSTPGATRMLASASTISIRLGAGMLGDGMSCDDRMSACEHAVPPTSVLTVTGTKSIATAVGSTAPRTRHRCSADIASRRQVDNKFACKPCRAATSDTFVPATKLSATIAALRAADQRRRRPPASPCPAPFVRNQLPSAMPSIAMPPAVRIGRQLPPSHANFVGGAAATVTMDLAAAPAAAESRRLGLVKRRRTARLPRVPGRTYQGRGTACGAAVRRRGCQRAMDGLALNKRHGGRAAFEFPRCVAASKVRPRMGASSARRLHAAARA